MRTDRRIEKRTAALALSIAAGWLLCSAALAGEAEGKIVLSGYADSAGGERLLAKDYSAVVAALGSHGVEFAHDPVSASTNLCIAYIMTGEWPKADSECDAAIRLARLDAQSGTLYGRMQHDQQVALAYSNRAVLRSLEAHPQDAARDLARALALAPSSELVMRNRAVLAGASGS